MQCFDFLFTSKELGIKKTSPDFNKNIPTSLKLKPQECVVIGNDYEKDIVPAHLLGIRTIWLFLTPVSKTGKAADFVIKSMMEVASVISTLNRKLAD
jgi:FMN phosphatase YigB (HAD superfamily)